MGGRVYRGIFDNTQVDYTDNSPNGQRVYVTITDNGLNGYQFTVSEFQVNVGSVDYLFTWVNAGDPAYPSGATATTIGYSSDGGLTWTDSTGTAISPRIINLPDPQTYTFRIKFEPDGEWYYFTTDTEIELDLADNPVRIFVTDNEEDKFTPIRSKSCEIRVHTSPNIDITTFTDGGDNRYFVEVAVGSLSGVVFSGWLSIQDITQDFQPHPNVLVLTATDGLGFLRDLPLTDYDGAEFSGENRLIDYISGALKKTGLDLDIVAEMNIREVDYAPFTDVVSFVAPNTILVPNGRNYIAGQKVKFSGTASNNGVFTISSVASIIVAQSLTVVETTVNEANVSATVDFYDGHFYNTIYLDCKTFEADINEFEDCYTVLEKILGENSTLFQQNNRWYIKRPDEIDQQLSERYFWDAAGTFQYVLSSADLKKQIGADNSLYTLCFMNQDALVSATRPHKFVRHEFLYETPKEIVCNINFSRGDELADLGDGEKTYQLDCWTLREGVPGFYGTVDGTTATIHRIFNGDDYETERYIVLTPRTTFETSSINDVTYIESQPIILQEKDKFTVSVDWRLENSIGTGGNGSCRLLRCVLEGDDGNWYILGEDTVGDNDPKWYNTTGWTTNTAKGAVSLDYDILDETEWNGVSWSAPPVPVGGKLYLWLNQFNQLNSSEDNVDIWYNNLSFSYIPFVNGSYKVFAGQYHKSEQNGDFKGSRTKQVYISDSPKRLFKGSLLKYNGSRYVLTEGFYNHLVFPSGPPSQDYIHPFGEIQNQDVWNQYRRRFFAFEGTLDGLDTDKTFESLPDLPDLHHYYEINDSSAMTNNKKFMLLHTEQDLDGCETNVYLVEAYDSLESKDYLGHEFKYIESDR